MIKKEYFKPELEMVDVKIETLLFNTSFESKPDDGDDDPWGIGGLGGGDETPEE